jgi:hypothetical protein
MRIRYMHNLLQFLCEKTTRTLVRARAGLKCQVVVKLRLLAVRSAASTSGGGGGGGGVIYLKVNRGFRGKGKAGWVLRATPTN